jgi:hypothetical protein
VSGVTGDSTAGAGAYSEGERTFGPPQGTYDVDWVAASARTADPGLPEETACLLAGQAWEHLRAIGELDAPEVARRLLADNRQAGATAANVVAVAAVEFCTSYAVDL